ncbi:MAG: FG-GAP repeat protein, partial [SAR202 cluster bacterium]|nr:FG-GAP repeat protein [SAR202 cluster bacterium]
DWIEQKLTASDAEAGDKFGVSVAIDGDYAIIGAMNEDPNGVVDGGCAYAFDSNEVAGWIENRKILPPSASQEGSNSLHALHTSASEGPVTEKIQVIPIKSG